jgi:exonuclease SbcD
LNVRAIITADNHLDPTALNFGPDRFERKKDHLKCFEEMVDYATKERPELLLIGGDLFDIMRPGNYARAAVMRDFRSLYDAGVKVFAVSGHHDTPRSMEEGTSPLAVYGNSGFIHYFQNPSAPETVTLDYKGFKVSVTGVGHNPLHEFGNDPVNAVPRELPGDFNIVIAHAPVQGFVGWTGDEPMIKPSAIPSKVNLLAVGHFHNHQEKRSGNTKIVYPGSTERVDFAEEADEKGFVWAEFQKDGSISTDFVKTSARKYKTVSINFPNVPKPLDELKAKMEESFDSQAVLRVKLLGKVDPVNLSGYRRSELLTYAQGKVFHCFVDEEELEIQAPEAGDVGQRTTLLGELEAHFERKIKEAIGEQKEVLREAFQLSRSKLQEAGAW